MSVVLGCLIGPLTPDELCVRRDILQHWRFIQHALLRQASARKVLRVGAHAYAMGWNGFFQHILTPGDLREAIRHGFLIPGSIKGYVICNWEIVKLMQ